MVLHAGENVGEVVEGIDAARLARGDERVEPGRLCGGPHRRNYAEVSIMRGPLRLQRELPIGVLKGAA